MKRKVIMIIAVLMILGIISIVISEISTGKKNSSDGDSISTPDEQQEQYYSYNQVEDMVEHLAGSDAEKRSLGRLVDPLNKSAYITVKYIKDVADIIGAPKEVYAGFIVGKLDGDYVTVDDFNSIYTNIVECGCVDGLKEEQIFIHSILDYVDENGARLYQVFDGVNMYDLDIDMPVEYENKILDVYIKNNIIFKINGFSDVTITFDRVWIADINDDECRFVCDGYEKSFKISEGIIDSESIKNIKEGTIAKVILDNSGILEIDVYRKLVEGRVTDVKNDKIYIENEGSFTYDDDLKIYDITDREIPICDNSTFVLQGYSAVKLIADGNKAVAVVVDGELVSKDIRVILSNDSYSSYNMTELTFNCDSSYKIKYSDDGESQKDAGKTITISYKDYEKGDVISIIPDDKDANITILSINRSYGNPIYKGTIEIRVQEDGLNIINILPLETYLYSVVSSEMPSGSSEEALKAMAVCTRGYACTKMLDKSFEKYYAHLDDSSLCQVYNNVQATPESIKAVKDTYGLVPVYEDKLIVPLYYSTSAGVSCTNSEIWGGSAYPYFRSCMDTIKKEDIDLSSEEVFVHFIQDSLDYNTIDKDMPYYRWNIEFTKDEISESINSMLEERLRVSSDSIKEKDKDGNLNSTDIKNIGTVQSIKVIERSKSGVALTLEIEGSLATIQVSGQTNIRNIITPVNQTIIRQDGSSVTGWTSLPSPYYYIDNNDNGFTIYGGGFGHGVGMSQSGAIILANQGQNYQFILRHYYSYVDFSSIYVVESE